MKARVKIPYYDTKLRRKGDIVEVKAPNRFVEALPEIETPEIEAPKIEPPKATTERTIKRAKNVRKG